MLAAVCAAAPPNRICSRQTPPTPPRDHSVDDD
jgi:hypothetical protein